MKSGLGHGLSWNIWSCCLPLGWPFYPGSVRLTHPFGRHNPSDSSSFQLPNTVFPHASNQYTQFARFATITKLSTCDNVFGALSTDGELFIFAPPEPKVGPGGEKVAIKPQLVWALRKAFTAVKVRAGGSIVASPHLACRISRWRLMDRLFSARIPVMPSCGQGTPKQPKAAPKLSSLGVFRTSSVSRPYTATTPERSQLFG